MHTVYNETISLVRKFKIYFFMPTDNGEFYISSVFGVTINRDATKIFQYVQLYSQFDFLFGTSALSSCSRLMSELGLALPRCTVKRLERPGLSCCIVESGS